MLKPAVLLDRDSTLTQRVYDKTRGVMASPLQLERVALRRDASTFVQSLNRLGYLCLVTTCQPELLTRRLTAVRLGRIHQKLRENLENNGARVDGIFFRCEKPDPGPLWKGRENGGATTGQVERSSQSLLVEAA